jgi:hypothetical protein
LLAVFYVNGSLLDVPHRPIGEAGSEPAGIRPPCKSLRGMVGGTETILFYTAFFFFTPWLSWIFLGMAGLHLPGYSSPFSLGKKSPDRKNRAREK